MNEDFASPEEVELARRIYCADSDNNVEVSNKARVSRNSDGIWVEARVFISYESIAISGFGEFN